MINKLTDTIKKFSNTIKNFDKVVKTIMKYGLEFSFSFISMAIIFLFIYILFLPSPNLYYLGIYIFKFALTIGIEFIICGIACDTIKKQLT